MVMFMLMMVVFSFMDMNIGGLMTCKLFRRITSNTEYQFQRHVTKSCLEDTGFGHNITDIITNTADAKREV